ncbi:hypothetical protein BDV35DRAFT_371542 [Aspergillus flavus]|uniref:Uncharacterized protein n=1 Tax=Aspergillus flavus TaxID=5059 RepID=A0A5N6GEZ7_ASPFL|nr:hypothetical protein BDV35DRAFT_371542 [Aspergillus flavus]
MEKIRERRVQNNPTISGNYVGYSFVDLRKCLSTPYNDSDAKGAVYHTGIFLEWIWPLAMTLPLLRRRSLRDPSGI